MVRRVLEGVVDVDGQSAAKGDVEHGGRDVLALGGRRSIDPRGRRRGEHESDCEREDGGRAETSDSVGRTGGDW